MTQHRPEPLALVLIALGVPLNWGCRGSDSSSPGSAGDSPTVSGASGGLASGFGGTRAASNINALGGTSALLGTSNFSDAIGGRVATGGTSATSGRSNGSDATGGVPSAGNPATGGFWSMGYYASWQASQYPVGAIEWSGMTHVAMAFYTPDAKGGLTLMSGDASLAKSLVSEAHAHGVKAIASLGGADSATTFRAATAAGAMDAFVRSIVALMQDPGYDGIDVDWEPLEHADEAVAIDLANRIRAQRSTAILTIPVGYLNVNIGGDLSQYPAIAAVYDQVNLMTYGMAGAWQGWKSWHSSALYQQDPATPTSIDSSVALYVKAGISKRKLGIGIGFYGLCYSPPVTGPLQALNGATLVAGDGAISYANIMTKYFSASAYHWDAAANAAYLSFASAQPPDGCGYISYDDEQSIEAKANYVKAQGLGGAIQWEINEGYMASAASGQKNPLLTAIANSLLH